LLAWSVQPAEKCVKPGEFSYQKESEDLCYKLLALNLQAVLMASNQENSHIRRRLKIYAKKSSKLQFLALNLPALMASNQENSHMRRRLKISATKNPPNFNFWN